MHMYIEGESYRAGKDGRLTVLHITLILTTQAVLHVCSYRDQASCLPNAVASDVLFAFSVAI